MTNFDYQKELARLEERKIFHEMKAKEAEHQRALFVIKVIETSIEQQKKEG